MLTPTQRAAINKKAADALAKDVLALAYLGGMPDTFWFTDQRIKRACKQLGIPAEAAKAIGVGEALRVRPDLCPHFEPEYSIEEIQKGRHR